MSTTLKTHAAVTASPTHPRVSWLRTFHPGWFAAVMGTADVHGEVVAAAEPGSAEDS